MSIKNPCQAAFRNRRPVALTDSSCERSRSPAVMERWVNKIATLEQKKQHYEEILRRELDGLDDEFETLRLPLWMR